MRIEGLPDDGKIGKKKWYEHYRMTEEQETEWREWMRQELSEMEESERKKTMDFVELLYGLNIRYKKEGELF